MSNYISSHAVNLVHGMRLDGGAIHVLRSTVALGVIVRASKKTTKGARMSWKGGRMAEPRVSDDELEEFVKRGEMQERCEKKGSVYPQWETIIRKFAYDLRDARARIVELEGENAKLEELMRNLAEFIAHEVPPGFFKNGVEGWGMDEGEGRAYEFLDSLRFTPQGRFLRTRIPELEKELATLKAKLATEPIDEDVPLDE